MIKILHVDDDRTAFEITRLGLQKISPDLELSWCRTGADALELIQKDSFDCILSDYSMPEMDGLEFLELLRERDKNIPFIILSGQANESKAVAALKAGSDAYFTKEMNIAHYQRLAHSIMKQVQVHTEHEQRLMERSWLDQSNSLIRTILQSAPIGFFATDPEGRVETTNQRCLEMLDIKPNKLIGTLEDLHKHLAETSYLTKDYKEFLSLLRHSREPIQVMLNNDSVLELSFERIESKDESIGFLICIADITERAMSELENRKLIDLMDNAPVPMIRVSRDGIIKFANQAGERLLRKWHSSVSNYLPKHLQTHLEGCVLMDQPVEIIDSSTMEDIRVMFTPPNIYDEVHLIALKFSYS